MNPRKRLTTKRGPCHSGAINEQTEISGNVSDGLNQEEFRRAMKKMVNKDVSDEETNRLFMQVDVYNRGIIGWDEYLTYMLLEKKNRESMEMAAKDTPLPTQVTKLKTYHKNTIEKICYIPSRRTVEPSGGQYVTMGKSGGINIWDKHFNLVSINRLIPFSRNIARNLWVTGMEPIPNYNMLAVSTVEGDTFFVDIAVGKFETTFVLTGMPHPVLCINYSCQSETSYMVLGDSAGNVAFFTFKYSADGLFGVLADKEKTTTRIKMADILNNQLPYVKAKVYKNLHNNWLKQVKYVPDLNGFLSCSLSSAQSLIGVNTARAQVFFRLALSGGVTCFDYDINQQVIATGSVDGDVRIWNIYTTKTPLMVLRAENSPVTHIICCSLNDQVIVLSRSRCLRVWDLRQQVCHQELSDFDLLPTTSQASAANNTPFSAIAFNEQSQQLVLAGAGHILLLHRSEKSAGDHEEPHAHKRQVTVTLYNKLFDRLVSGCQGSVVCVWDGATGRRLLHFTHVHTTILSAQPMPVPITCMKFDASLRRLITASKHAQVKLWNFNNGDCLRILNAPSKQPFLALALARQQILCVGVGRTVTQFSNGCDGDGSALTDSEATEWPAEHKCPVLAVGCRLPSMVVTAGGRGELCSWTLQTGRLHSRLDIRQRAIFSGSSQLQALEQADNCGETISKTGGSSEKDRIKDSPIELQQSTPTEVSNDRQDRSTTSEAAVTERDNSLHNNLPNSSCSLPDITALLMLNNRRHAAHTASLLTSCSSGQVTAWSLHHEGGLLHRFRAAVGPMKQFKSASNDNTPADGEITACKNKHDDNKANSVNEATDVSKIRSVVNNTVGVSAMCTDTHEHLLATADSAGYVRVWLIASYFCGPNPPLIHWPDYMSRFPFLSMPQQCRRRHQINDPLSPPLLTSFRAHLRTISSIDMCSEHNILVTTSSDQTARVWTLDGRHIGTLGQKFNWQRPPVQRRLPADVRREASSCSLKVFNGGGHPLWRGVQKALLVRASKVREENNQQLQLHRIAAVKTGSERSTESLAKTSINSLHVGELHTQIGSKDRPILGHFWRRRMSKHIATPHMKWARFVNGQAMVYSLLQTSAEHEIQPFQIPPVLKPLYDKHCHKSERTTKRTRLTAIMRR